MIEISTEVCHPASGAAVVMLKGEHDLTNADQTWAILEGLLARNDLVVVDVSEAEFIDSTVISNFLRAHRSAEAEAKTFRLQLGTTPIVHRALEICGVLSVLDVATSREEALSVDDAASPATGTLVEKMAG